MKNLDFEQFNFTPTLHSEKAIKIFFRHAYSRKISLNERGLSQKDIDFIRSTGKYPEYFIDSLIVRCKKIVSRPKHKIHKEFTPKNVSNTIKFSIGRQLIAPLSKHDFNHNPYIRKVRKMKKQRLNLRDELEEMCKTVFPAFVKHCEYSIYAECLFEVKAPLKQLAMELGILTKNDRYDRLNRLIDMMQEAGLIVVMHEFDKERYKQKAVRIFLLPDFFYSLGHTEESLKRMVAATNLHLIKKGSKDSLIQRAKIHEERLKDLNVADMQANSKNAEKYALLKRVKADFLNDKAFHSLNNKTAKFERNNALKQENPSKDESLPDMPLTLEELRYFMDEKKAQLIFPPGSNDIKRPLH